MRNSIKKKIFKEFDCDFESSGLTREAYIEDCEFVLDSMDFVDYTIVDIIFNNLGVNDIQLVKKCWKKWKERK